MYQYIAGLIQIEVVGGFKERHNNEAIGFDRRRLAGVCKLHPAGDGQAIGKQHGVEVDGNPGPLIRDQLSFHRIQLKVIDDGDRDRRNDTDRRNPKTPFFVARHGAL